jgi:hypothetical protein
MKIINPEQTTYFICRNDENFTITAYGEVSPEQEMKTGQPIVDTYLDKDEWEQVLIDNGIEIEPEEIQPIEGMLYF